jgi:DNA-binding SARP family transcriptional activator
VLALLLLHLNEVVSSERLIEDLWAGKSPASAAKVLQGYISQLRRALPADTILTRGQGYCLAAAETDAGEFELLVRAAAGQDAAHAVETLSPAHALWRGRPFQEFEYEEWAQVEIARLEELRLVAVEHRLEAELELGRHAQAIPELEALVAEHPLREQLRGLLMVALYRCGRQADALEVYRHGRHVLHEELGLDPSPSLQELERQMLNHDSKLETTASPKSLFAGTVTFLFTDIEGSTRLLRQLGDAYGDVLADHRGILRSAAAEHDGREVDRQGDSFFAFARANAALGAAVDAQRALDAHEWPDGARVRVRMGLHTAEATIRDDRYVGLGVHRPRG